ncbi:MAG: hypothetical protein DRJ96_04490 [Thermoprotei archaeon]|nr:MAG: hypothetical protein DRJ67_02985 [Thermoprotei archaeon]RLE97211.1 MAG: hypothetical protein DRJ96_04490 [Thermoprotei archaeon]
MLTEDYARIINSLKGRVKEWKIALGGVVLIPLHAGFDLLIVGKRPLGYSSDFKWTFTASVIIKWPPSKIAEAYRRLKAMECELRVEGFFRRRYSFVESTVRRALFPSMKFDKRLAKSLEESHELADLLRRASPDELYISTYYELKPGKSVVECLFESFSRPEKLGWLITASKGPEADLILPRVARAMYDLLDQLAHHLRRLTPLLLEEGVKP